MNNRNYRLLLVDDNLQSLKLLKAIYDSEGYKTETANDGKEAMDILLKVQIDLIVTDVLMPNIDGYYLCYKVRANEKLKNIPIIIYTATYTSQSEENIAMEMGADLFIRKPAALKVLLSAVQEILKTPKDRHFKISRTAESFEMMHQYSSELVTKLEHRNIELEQATDNLETTINHFKHAELIAHLGHWSVEIDSGAIYWSDEMYRIFGSEPNTFQPTLDSLIKFIHPEDQEQISRLMQQDVMQQTLEPLTYAYRIIRSDGTVRCVLSSCEYETDNSAKGASRLYGTLMDVTDLTEKEQKLAQANKELAAFIYSAYHDLRSPIVSILGLVSLAVEEKNVTDALRYFTFIKAVAIKQNKMLLNLVKVMSVRDKELLPELVETNKLINDILFSFRDNEGFRKVKILINNHLTHPIFIDHELLFGILSELIDNSILYQRSTEPEIIITLFKDNDLNMGIEIKDNGIGMEEEVKDKVFNVFFRGNSISQGSGLGLYYVKNAVERLGGSIKLTSTEGLGSDFQIKIPNTVKEG
jgi:two-component system cell cycle sensor histidine kinase/response regulator CckA